MSFTRREKEQIRKLVAHYVKYWHMAYPKAEKKALKVVRNKQKMRKNGKRNGFTKRKGSYA